jgi:hypothetical protein
MTSDVFTHWCVAFCTVTLQKRYVVAATAAPAAASWYPCSALLMLELCAFAEHYPPSRARHHRTPVHEATKQGLIISVFGFYSLHHGYDNQRNAELQEPYSNTCTKQWALLCMYVCQTALHHK